MACTDNFCEQYKFWSGLTNKITTEKRGADTLGGHSQITLRSPEDKRKI